MEHHGSKSSQKLAANKLKKILDSPERREQEKAFAEQHAHDSDEELFSYLVMRKKEAGKRLKAADVIGYRYLTDRLGPWPAVMTKVNAVITEEKNQLIGGNEE